MKKGRPTREAQKRQIERKHRFACLLRGGLSVDEARRMMRLNRGTAYRWRDELQMPKRAWERKPCGRIEEKELPDAR